MKTRIHALCAAATVAVASFAIHAPDAGAATPAASATGDSAPATSRRYQLVHRLVMKWGAHVHEAYDLSPRTWAREMGGIFAMSSLDTLQRAADADDFDAMSNLLLGKAPTGSASLQPEPAQTLLGDAAADLVYVPVTPCRILDTRLAGGPIAAGATRGFDVSAASSYSAQGGSSGNCGVGAAGSFAAAAITFTVVNPPGQGYITAFPYNTTRPVAATMAFGGGGLATNTSVVKLDQGGLSSEMSIYSPGQVHVVGDIIGYFTAPQPTALECTEVVNGPTSLPANSSLGLLSPECPVGYQVTGGSCMMASIHGRVVTTNTRVAFNDHFCSFYNQSVGAIDGTAKATCCRVPGR